jgi:hypothetical protein
MDPFVGPSQSAGVRLLLPFFDAFEGGGIMQHRVK